MIINTKGYKYIKTQYILKNNDCKKINFKSSTDVYIGLFNNNNIVCEIVIGGWNNTKSVIRYEKQGQNIMEYLHNYCNNDYFNHIIIYYNGNSIKIYDNNNNNILSCKINNLEILNIKLSSYLNLNCDYIIEDCVNIYDTPKNIIGIFAGRERYISILKKYLDICIDKNIIHEVHIWDFTRNNEDTYYIKQLCNNKNYIYKHVINKNIWCEFYNYYYHSMSPSDILFKCDDDVIYINVDDLKMFIENIKEPCLYFPNIVNNDVCAYFQTKNNIHDLFDYNLHYNHLDSIGISSPLTLWYTDFNKAYKIHSLFLENKQKFLLKNKDLIEYGNRISINFFGINYYGVDKYFKQLKYNINIDDETYIPIINKILNQNNIINLNLTVVHFQFNPQNGIELDKIYLEKYNNLI